MIFQMFFLNLQNFHKYFLKLFFASCTTVASSFVAKTLIFSNFWFFFSNFYPMKFSVRFEVKYHWAHWIVCTWGQNQRWRLGFARSSALRAFNFKSARKSSEKFVWVLRSLREKYLSMIEVGEGGDPQVLRTRLKLDVHLDHKYKSSRNDGKTGSGAKG